MYYGNQVVFDLDTRRPVQLKNSTTWAWTAPRHSVHFVSVSGDDDDPYLPESEDAANMLLFRGLIRPAWASVEELHTWRFTWTRGQKCLCLPLQEG